VADGDASADGRINRAADPATGAVRLRSAVAVLAVAGLMACTPIFRDHGYTPTDDQLAEVVVGVDTRDSVEGTLGRPSSAGLLDGSGLYYVSSRRRHFAWRAPQEIEREVVAISFDDDGVVTNIERFGLEDGNVVALSRRVTDTNIRGVTFIGQLLGNLGNLRAEDIAQ